MLSPSDILQLSSRFFLHIGHAIFILPLFHLVSMYLMAHALQKQCPQLNSSLVMQ